MNLACRLINQDSASEVQQNSHDILCEMMKAQWMRKEELNNRVLNNVKNILNHSYRHVPFYKHLYRSLRVDPDQLTTLNDLRKFPIVTKEELRLAGEKALADNVDKSRLSSHATSGTTAISLKFYHDFDWGIRRIASKWLFDSYFGARPQSRYFSILFDPPSKNNIDKGSFFMDKISKILSACPISFKSDQVNPLQEYSFSYLELNRISEIINDLIKFKPEYGYGAPSLLHLFLNAMNEKKTQMPKLKAVVSSIEALLETERRKFEEEFECPIFNRYGSRELYGAVAGECEYHSGLHVNLDLFMIEIVDDNNEPCSTGEVGNIILTDFYNKSMPFIRYKIGDFASLESRCDCKRSFPMLGQLIGRTSEFAINKDGQKIPLIGLFHSLDEKIMDLRFAESINQFQFKQIKPGHLVMYIVPSNKWNESRVKEKMNEMGKINGIDFDFEIVEKITSFPSGKRQILLT
jgi:phenylacetate-CoA ligase